MSINAEEPSKASPSRLQTAMAGALAAGLGVRLGPAGAITGAAVAPYLPDLFNRVRDEFNRDQRGRVETMFESASEAQGCEPAEVLRQAGASERSRLLTAAAMNAAAGTAWPPKVCAIGRALAEGLIATDDAKIDVQKLALAAMAEMEAPHVRLLELLVRYTVRRMSDTELAVVRYEDNRSPELQEKHWTLGGREWSAERICMARPQLQPVFTALIGTLDRHGLARQNDRLILRLEMYALDLESFLTHLYVRPSVGAPMAPRGQPLKIPSLRDQPEPIPTWSPTELGERVLAFYDEAAMEEDSAQISAGPVS